MQTEIVMMPRELTAENGAKTALIGEFFETRNVDCPECEGTGAEDDGDVCDYCGGDGYETIRIPVSWTTIKEIYKKAVEHLAT